MLVAVTARPTLIAALNKASVAARYTGGASVRVLAVPLLSEAVHPGLPSSLLVLDLCCCAHDPDLVEALTSWKFANPSREIVVVDTLKDRSKVGELFWYLGKLCAGAPLSDAQACDPDYWVAAYLRFPFSRVMAEVQQAFASTLEHDVPNKEIIQTQLALSPQLSRVDEMAEELDGGDVEHATKRSNLQWIFREARQATPKDFISAFRLLTHNWLRELHAKDSRLWKPGQIAAALTAPNSREMRRVFARRAGIQYSRLCEIPTANVLGLCAALATPQDDRPNYRELVQCVAGDFASPLLRRSTLREVRR